MMSMDTSAESLKLQPHQAENGDAVTAAANAPKDAPNDADSSKPKEQWGNDIEFLFSCISLSVGLGNIWRFPYIAFQNGGGAFVIPYLIVLLIIGRPVYYLEIILGQFSGRGCIEAFNLAPILKVVHWDSDGGDNEEQVVEKVPRQGYRIFRRINIDWISDEAFISRFRLSKGTVFKILQMTKPLLSFNIRNKRSRYISPLYRLLIALRFYASGSFQVVVEDFIGCCRSTVRVVLPK